MSHVDEARRPLDVFLVAGELSGDELGFKLMRALRGSNCGAVCFRGVGGPAMTREGLSSLFGLSDIAVMGFVPVIRRLPLLLRRLRETAAAIVQSPPDILVIIDSPDFTHRVARRVRRALPDLPIVDYVSPSVWAWRPRRAPRMRAYVNHVLAVLPFEPAVHRRLGGPPCTYVGHPLIERLADLQPDAADRLRRASAPPVLLCLPGSRRSEIERLMAVFGETIARVVEAHGPVEVVLPAVAHLADDIRAQAAKWPIAPLIVTGEAEKWSAFRRARAALAASGTVTLELALAHVPLVVAYKVRRVEMLLKYIVTVNAIALPNIILGRRAIPEFLQDEGDPERLAGALLPLLRDGPERDAQSAAFAALETAMRLPDGEAPSERAARIITTLAQRTAREGAGSGGASHPY